MKKGNFPTGIWPRKYQLIDLEAGLKITGAGFPVYKGVGARLQRALFISSWKKT